MCGVGVAYLTALNGLHWSINKHIDSFTCYLVKMGPRDRGAGRESGLQVKTLSGEMVIFGGGLAGKWLTLSCSEELGQ